MSFPIQLDFALNLLWVAICVAGLIAAIRGEVMLIGAVNRAGRWRRSIAWMVVMLAIFPSVSASDDELCLWYLNTSSSPRGAMGVPVEEKEKTSQNLARLFDIVEQCQLSGTWALIVTLCFLSLIQCAAQKRTVRALLQEAGRSPPAL